jgi:hypothetical protein
MKSFLLVILAVCSVSLLNAEPCKDYGTGHWLIRGLVAQESILQNHKYTKKEFGDWCEVLGYISGVAMMGQGRDWIFPSNSTKQQFIAIIIKYTNARPERWGDSADVIISRALAEAFPINKAGINNSINSVQ